MIDENIIRDIPKLKACRTKLTETFSFYLKPLTNTSGTVKTFSMAVNINEASLTVKRPNLYAHCDLFSTIMQYKIAATHSIRNTNLTVHKRASVSFHESSGLVLTRLNRSLVTIADTT